MTPVVKTNPSGVWFKTALMSLLAARGDILGAAAHLRGQPGCGPAANALHHKAVVGALDTSDATGFRVLAQSLAEFIRPATLLGKLPVLRVPPNTRIIRQDGATVAYWPGEGLPAGLSAAAYSDLLSLEPMTVSAIALVSDELARHASPDAGEIVGADVRRALVEAMDAAFADPTNTGTAGKPASVTSSAVEFTSTGATVAAITADALRLLGVVCGANADPAMSYWLMSPTAAAHLHGLSATGAAPSFASVGPRGGTWFGQPVLTSNAMLEAGSPAASTIALVDANSIAVVDDGEGDFDIVTQADVQAVSNPSSGAQSLLSLWQNGIQAVRAQRFTNWRVRRSNAVATLRHCAF